MLVNWVRNAHFLGDFLPYDSCKVFDPIKESSHIGIAELVCRIYERHQLCVPFNLARYYQIAYNDSGATLKNHHFIHLNGPPGFQREMAQKYYLAAEQRLLG